MAQDTLALSEQLGLSLSPEMAKEFEAEAKDNLAHVNDAFYRVSIQGARYKVEGKLIGNEGIRFDAVILKELPVNLFYKTKFDPQSPTPPDCFSQGGYAPDASVAFKEAATCGECPHNQYGSGKDETGKPSKGKACANTRRLVLKVEGVDLPVLLALPPTSTKTFNQFLKELTGLKVAYSGIVTEFSFDSSVQYPKPIMKAKRVLTADEWTAVKEQRSSTAVTNALKAFASSDEVRSQSKETETF